MKKDLLFERRQIAHIKNECLILRSIDNPFIVNFKWSFQTKYKL